MISYHSGNSAAGQNSLSELTLSLCHSPGCHYGVLQRLGRRNFEMFDTKGLENRGCVCVCMRVCVCVHSYVSVCGVGQAKGEICFTFLS